MCWCVSVCVSVFFRYHGLVKLNKYKNIHDIVLSPFTPTARSRFSLELRRTQNRVMGHLLEQLFLPLRSGDAIYTVFQKK